MEKDVKTLKAFWVDPEKNGRNIIQVFSDYYPPEGLVPGERIQVFGGGAYPAFYIVEKVDKDVGCRLDLLLQRYFPLETFYFITAKHEFNVIGLTKENYLYHYTSTGAKKVIDKRVFIGE